MENGSESHDEGNERNPVKENIDKNVKILVDDLHELQEKFDELAVLDTINNVYTFNIRIKGNLIFHSVYWNFAELRNELGRYSLNNEVEISTRIHEVIQSMQTIFEGCQTKEELKTELDNLIKLFEELKQIEV